MKTSELILKELAQAIAEYNTEECGLVLPSDIPDSTLVQFYNNKLINNYNKIMDKQWDTWLELNK